MVRLKRKGMLEYVRGRIRLLDVDALERETCECYAILKDHFNNYVPFDTGFSV